MNGKNIKLDIRSSYPYDGKIRITVETEAEFSLRLRIPGWCRSWKLSSCGKDYSEPVISRQWHAGDAVELTLDMPVDVLYSNPRITGNLGRAALRRGPVVYALEECDQTCPVREMLLDLDKPVTLTAVDGLPGETVALRGSALRESFAESDLYTVNKPAYTPVSFTAIPYALWQNRGAANMCVWNRFVKH